MLAHAVKISLKKQLVTLTGEASNVKAGVTLGVVRKGRKPMILINKNSAQTQGAKFAPVLLRFAKLY